jgi:DNA-binding PadR family transcriptional regulator
MDEGSSKLGAIGRRGAYRGAVLPSGAPLFAGKSFEQTPPRMDVKFPILGFLKDAEATGYDLKNRFRDPVGFFYRVSDGSIYPALKTLARDGLVTLRSERQGRRTRKVYAITPRGREHFRRMLHEPAQPLFVFDESQIKIYFADQEPEIAIEHMVRACRDDETRSAILARMVTEMRRAGASPVRRIMVELGCAITAAKAGVLKRLCAQLRREIQVNRRASQPTVNGTAREPMKTRNLTPNPFPRGKGNKNGLVHADKKVSRRDSIG